RVADRKGLEQVLEAVEGRPERDDSLPLADNLLDRCEGTAHDDRRRQYGSGRDFPIDGKPCSDTKKGDLHREPGEFHQRMKRSAPLGGGTMDCDMRILGAGPAVEHNITHAETTDYLTVAQRGGGKTVGLVRE